MANAPILTVRSTTSPFSALFSIPLVQTSPSGNTLPVNQGETSNATLFRLYNNFGLSSTIASAFNIQITAFDGAGSSSHTCIGSPASQCWLMIQQYGFGENSTTSPDRFSYYLDLLTPIGGSGPCGSSVYIPSIGSDGIFGSDQIRAYSSGNGTGFIEFSLEAQIPSGAGYNSYNPAISVIYEWIG